jgi:voltage-gated potassium channel Kch
MGIIEGTAAVALVVLAIAFRLRHIIIWMTASSEGRGVLSAAIAAVGGGTFFYHSVEGWGWLDSLYFSTVTLATVGFGDFAPATPAGRLFTVVYLIVGLGILAEFIRLAARAPHPKRGDHERAP